MRADARRNRERVLEAAQAAFAELGSAVSIDEIARRAGVGAGTVHRHFPTKDALFGAVVVERYRQLVDEARMLATADDPGAAFFGYVARVVEEGIAKTDLVNALSGVGIGVDLGGTVISRDLLDAAEVLLERAQRAGQVRSDIGPADVLALLAGATLASRRYGGASGSDRRILAVLCDGLRAGLPPERRDQDE